MLAVCKKFGWVCPFVASVICGVLFWPNSVALAQYKQPINTSDVLIGVYNHDLRFGDTLLWNGASGVNQFTRYMNGNFGPNGEVLLATGSSPNGSALRINAATGATIESLPGANSSIRSVAYLGSAYFYGTGSGNIVGSTAALNDGSTTNNAVASGTVSLVTDGTFLYAGGSGDDQVRKFSASGESLTQVASSTSALPDDPRGMQYFNGYVYASSGTGGIINVYNAGDLSLAGTLSGTSIGFNNEGFSIFSLGGKNWYVGAEMVNAGLRNALVVRELTSPTTLSAAADYYRYAVTGGSSTSAFNLVGNNSGLTGLSINPNVGVGYFGSNENAGIWAYSVSVVPEPSGAGLLLLGAGALLRARRRTFHK